MALMGYSPLLKMTVQATSQPHLPQMLGSISQQHVTLIIFSKNYVSPPHVQNVMLGRQGEQ